MNFTFFEADEVYGTLALDDVKNLTFLVHFSSASWMHCYECIQTEVFRSESVLNNFCGWKDLTQ